MGFEIRVDCGACTVEGARIETWEPDAASCRLGIPASVRCRFCEHAAAGRATGATHLAPGDGCPGCGGPADDWMLEAHRCAVCGAHAFLEDVGAAAIPRDPAAIDAALLRWAREEGLASTRELVEAYFVLSDVAAVVDALARGEHVETTFDVADYLFSGGGGSGAATAGPAVMREEEAPITERVPQPPSLRKVGGPREELLAIASVAAADGEASADDAVVLVRAADKRGIPPLAPEDVRVWRPAEIDPPATLLDRERVLEEMFQMGWADGQMDESELRVIRDFSRAWGIDPDRLREWTELYSFGDTNRIERWFRRIGLFLFPAR